MINTDGLWMKQPFFLRFSVICYLSVFVSYSYGEDTTLSEFKTYKNTLFAEFATYKKINQEELNNYRAAIKHHWDKAEISSKTVWVDYSADYQQKNRVDFAKGNIRITRIQSKNTAKVDIRQALIKLLNTSTKQAFDQDQLSQAIERRSKAELTQVKTAVVKPEPVLLPFLTKKTTLKAKEVEALADALLEEKKITRHRDRHNRTLITLQIPLSVEQETKPAVDVHIADKTKRIQKPANDEYVKVLAGFFSVASQPSLSLSEKQKKLPRKAQLIARYVGEHAQKYNVAEPLIYAVIDAESSFNPMAKSGIPAYGLMQIVPESAGQDATHKIFGEPKILAPSYLYNSEKNIEIGVVYIHILYYRYLKAIKDPISRLYCTIAAYNTGAGNVAKAFNGTRNITKAAKTINSMTPEQVYTRLILKLPYKETRKYLKKINRILPKYRV